MKEKGDECIFVGYSTHSRAYRVFNKRTRAIMESIHVNFNKVPQMASDHNSSDPAPECQTMTMASVQISSDLAPKCQTMALEHDSLSPSLVSKSSAVSAADAPYQRQQHTTPLNTHTTPIPTCQTPSITTTVRSSENINQAELHAE
nr:Gag-Pol polyprotein [Tanacetum cinerariifolium]